MLTDQLIGFSIRSYIKEKSFFLYVWLLVCMVACMYGCSNAVHTVSCRTHTFAYMYNTYSVVVFAIDLPACVCSQDADDGKEPPGKD